MNADGSGVTQMTCLGGAVPAEPAWSPDGSQIVFATLDNLWVVRLDGTRIAFSSSVGGPSQVWVMNADGSGLFSFNGTGADRDPDWQL